MEDEEFVEILFVGLLGRLPDTAARRNFVSALKNGIDPKLLYQQVFNSVEFAERARRINSNPNSLGEVCVTDSSVALLPDYQERILLMLSLLSPVDVVGLGKVRVGRNNDGGYVMIDDFEGITDAYSLGISDDVSWDRQIAERGIKVFQYDHTIDSLPEEHENFRWLKRKIASHSDIKQGVISLQDQFFMNGHGSDRDYILKVDIEGDEWEVFSAIDVDFLKLFRQVICEFHHISEIANPHKFEKMHGAIYNLTVHHSVAHVHGNNYARWAIVGGVAVPDVLEITFIRNTGKKFNKCSGTFPDRFDQPNSARFADFMLGSFRFGDGRS
ncbi:MULTISPECIES: FkbM family methyltransferase [unclassified Methylobacterium]|uniref:FkbM family methyltransferase n=1 Tax=unclassified Methylobacterium TaxID=2615210 RepID=UPI00226AF136|nr:MULTISPECIES: FkbM family methyltransferase [unclassified Methylobacterium]